MSQYYYVFNLKVFKLLYRIKIARIKSIVILFLLLFSSDSFAQLQISQTGTVAQWVQNVLVGQGVSVSNITYTGSSQSVGLFSTGNNTGNLGLLNGIVLSTGKVTDMPGNATINASTNTNGNSDAQLAGLITQTIYDAAVLEFDFVPMADTIKFNFVFGSEEYPEYVNSFNDVFGFFISGFNPSGGMYANQNIALVPGTTNTPVSIYNVNNGSTNSGPCTNCQYYVNNSTGTFVKMDGFTTVLTAIAGVVPCFTYHIKIAIGDAGDHVYDSGVFLEAGSFTSNAAILMKSTSTGIDTVAIEGCNDAIVHFVLPDTATSNKTITYVLSGTATNGVDYTLISNNAVTIPAGQISASVTVHPILDNLNEPMEYVDFFVNTTPCTMDTIRVYIKNNTPVEFSLPSDTTICRNDSIFIKAFPTGGYTPYTYLWSTGDSLDSISTAPYTDTIYYLQVTDLCGNDSIDSMVVNISEPVFQVFGDTVCNGDSAFIGVISPMVNTYQWSSGQQTQQFYFLPTVSSSYTVEVRDSLNCPMVDTVDVLVKSAPKVVVSNDTIICDGASALLKVYGNYLCQWDNGTNKSSILVSPNTTSQYHVIISDSSGCSDSALIEVEVLPSPIAEISIPVDTLCRGKTVILEGSGGDQYFWSTGSVMQNISVSPMATSQYTLKVISVANATRCSDDTTVKLIVKRCNYIYTPTAFTPNNDGLNDKFGAEGIFEALASYRMIIYNRWGEKVYECTSPFEKWDGRYKGQNAPQDVYTYIIIVEELKMEPYTLRGTIQLIR
jgi:gliding motility-associated-like protein